MKFEITIDSENLRDLVDFVDIKQTDRGLTSYYQMSLKELINVFSSSTHSKEESPYLPRNCFKYIHTTEGYDVYIDVPATQWEIDYNGFKLKTGFPRLIFKYVLNGVHGGTYNVNLDKIVAVKGKKRINGDTELFHFPYSHVDEKGNVCMGGNRFPNIKCLSELETLHLLFFRSPFSNDYGAKIAIKKPLSEIFFEFNEKDFDESVLLPKKETFSGYFRLEK